MEGVSYDLLPSHNEKTLNAMKAQRTVKLIIFNPSEAKPGETLNVHVPNLNENEVIVPNSLALIFDIDLSGGHANNFLVQNVSRALVEKLVVRFAGEILDQTDGHDIYKTFHDSGKEFAYARTKRADLQQICNRSVLTKTDQLQTNLPSAESVSSLLQTLSLNTLRDF